MSSRRPRGATGTGTGTGPAAAEVRAAVSRLEGYLAWEAEISAAHRDAETFACRFDWLPDGQRREIEQAYAADRLRYAEGVVDRAVTRCQQLKEEYSRRYRLACARWSAACLAVMAVTGLLAALPVLLRG
ncbi:cytochrome C oxidase subunit I [Kitasatospora camelliae]|uniref:Cytochrome C oxidase subunit I n=1 Tax=Kitasatospora camelliae TaxID=3156397 RepID=A0AAU8JPK6_9ACTN